MDNLHTELGKKNKIFYYNLELQRLIAKMCENTYSLRIFQSLETGEKLPFSPQFRLKNENFLCVIQIYTKFGNFEKLCTPYFLTFRHETLRSTIAGIK